LGATAIQLAPKGAPAGTGIRSPLGK
jgi:hypothetical protein